MLTSASLLPERQIIPAYLLRSQALCLLINCDHLLKRVRFYFPPDLVTLKNAPKLPIFKFIGFFKMFRVEKDKVDFFGGSCLIVIFLPFC